ncbi:hypothetical protein E2562_027531 [Oryza meyeriana var. granulata]|uniref:Integrase catalytic domain-containing protein n=1 Tax=Oryza meyeriana var. granulata TaxID=110450 RepID=A0A6G1CJ08_9ORYZ|nr:hypothetical protein E2562_027531 [Oryza meyeriana var. granulata]
MDFIEALPRVGGKSVILTIVDRFSKYCHFISLAHPYSAESVAQVFFFDIVRLHGIPQSIVSDRDLKELLRLTGVKLHMTTAFHPQSDGQTEAANKGRKKIVPYLQGRSLNVTRHHSSPSNQIQGSSGGSDGDRRALGVPPQVDQRDVDEFIASDPVYVPQLKALRESRKFALGRALIGRAHLSGVALKYSKAPHGVLLATGFRAICGAVIRSEVAEHWYQLYKADKQGANLR